MDLSATHLHLLLNHVPTVGFSIGLALLVFGLITKSEHLKIASLVTLVGIALVTVPVFVTGGAAQEAICVGTDTPGPCPDEGTSRALIEMHEGIAFVALVLIEFVGGFAWLGLWQWRRYRRIPAATIALVLVFSALAFGVVAQAAAVGGEIRHPEIRVTQPPEEPQIARVIGTYIANTPWTFGSLEAIHMIGLTVLLGVVLLIDLKLLGFLPTVPYSAVERLLPWAILGFGVNVISGMLFFIAASYQYVGNPSFNGKLVFLMLAGVNMLLFTFDQSWKREGQPATGYSKFLAVSAVVLWVGVLFWGSMLPFIGQAF
jgi:hypothetical protein